MSTSLRFVVKVDAIAKQRRLLDSRSDQREVLCLDQHAAHEVALPTDRFVYERVGWSESLLAYSSPSNIAPTESATARSDFAKAWA